MKSQQAKAAADKATGRTATAPAPPKPATATKPLPGTTAAAAAAGTKKSTATPPPPGPKRASPTAPAVPAGQKMESKEDAAALRKLHLALTADGGVGGAVGGGGVGGDGMSLAVADGYKPSPYLQEVMQVLEDTKVREGRDDGDDVMRRWRWFVRGGQRGVGGGDAMVAALVEAAEDTETWGTNGGDGRRWWALRPCCEWRWLLLWLWSYE